MGCYDTVIETLPTFSQLSPNVGSLFEGLFSLFVPVFLLPHWWQDGRGTNVCGELICEHELAEFFCSELWTVSECHSEQTLPSKTVIVLLADVLFIMYISGHFEYESTMTSNILPIIGPAKSHGFFRKEPLAMTMDVEGLLQTNSYAPDKLDSPLHSPPTSYRCLATKRGFDLNSSHSSCSLVALMEVTQNLLL